MFHPLSSAHIVNITIEILVGMLMWIKFHAEKKEPTVHGIGGKLVPHSR
jgi:hypothetical protein